MAAAEILEAIARLNLACAAVILLVIAIRVPARRWLGAVSAYRLWLLPPVAGLALLIPPRQVVLPAPTTSLAPNPLTGPSFEVQAILPAAPPGLSTAAALLLIWLAGVLAAALVMAHLQRRFVAAARKGLAGPAVVGVFRPRIVTPADFAARFTAQEQSLILAHEEAHLAARHSSVNALAAALQCLCWFNPLVHLAAHLMRIDQEMACDEAVVARFPDGRADYAHALVRSQLAARPLPLGCHWPSRSEHPLVERLKMLKSGNPTRVRRISGLAALVALASMTGLAAWSAQPPAVKLQAPAVPSPQPPRPDRTTPAPKVEAAPVRPAEPASPPEPAAEVCLTNACSEGRSGPASPAEIRAAIEAGDGLKVRALGGTAEDIVASTRRRIELDIAAGHVPASAMEQVSNVLGRLDRFIDPGRGPIVMMGPQGPGMRRTDGTYDPVNTIMERQTASGCVERVNLLENGNTFVGGICPD